MLIQHYLHYYVKGIHDQSRALIEHPLGISPALWQPLPVSSLSVQLMDVTSVRSHFLCLVCSGGGAKVDPFACRKLT